MFDWKIILAIIAALLLLTGGLLKDIGKGFQGEDVKEFLNEIKDRLSDVINISDFKVPVERNLNVSGVLENKNSFDFEPPKTGIDLKYETGQMNLSVDNRKIRIEGDSAVIVLKDFNGDVEMTPDKIDLDGRMDSLTSESFKMEGKNIPVSGEGEYEEVGFKNIKVNKLKVKEGGGKLDIGKSTTVTVGEKLIVLHSFFGNLTFKNNEVTLRGKASKVTSGTQKIAVSMFP